MKYCANLAVVHEYPDDPCLSAFEPKAETKACHYKKGWDGPKLSSKSATIALLFVQNLASRCNTCRMLASCDREAPSCAPMDQCSGSSGGLNDAEAGPYGPST